MLAYAVREGLLLDNPARLVERRKLPKRRIVIPSHDQFRKLVEQIRRADRRAQHGANLVELLAYSGMRLTEAVILQGEMARFDAEEQSRRALTASQTAVLPEERLRVTAAPVNAQATCVAAQAGG